MARARAAVAGHRPRQLHTHTARGAADHTRLAAGFSQFRGPRSVVGVLPSALTGLVTRHSSSFLSTLLLLLLLVLLHKLVQCSVFIVPGIIPSLLPSPPTYNPRPPPPMRPNPTHRAPDLVTTRSTRLTDRFDSFD